MGATCPDCGSELVQKSRRRLLIVAVLMTIAAAVLLLVPYVRVASVLLFAVSAYLVVWATIGGALWCRTCKRFPRRSVA